jgi:hypothetical protein
MRVARVIAEELRRLLALWMRVGFANSGGLVFMDESAEEIPPL